MLEITALTGMRSPAAVTIALTLPLLLAICVIGVSVRISTPSDSATRTSAFGTAAVPPFGYQTPSFVCMCAMLDSTAGDANGLEPTYWVK